MKLTINLDSIFGYKQCVVFTTLQIDKLEFESLKSKLFLAEPIDFWVP